jgi:enoyl-CoA hydratase/carnithine racemase
LCFFFFVQSDEANVACQAILIRGFGSKSFCAGGDIVSIVKDAEKARAGDGNAYERYVNFFRDEYRLNYLISNLTTPYIPWLNGIVMGGGVGISVHNRIRVATETSLFAMPETAIGFFPDVGGSHFLPRLDSGLGMYLGLTGARLKGADLVHAGIATHFALSHEYDNLYNKLNDGHERSDFVYRSLAEVAQPQASFAGFSLERHMDCIHRCFTQPSIEQVFEALRAETKDTAFAHETLRTLEKLSPLSLKVTFEQLRRGASLDLAEALTQEFRIAQNMIYNKDFTAGVSSLLIKKDGKPQWQHASVKDVPDAAAARFFDLPADGKELDFEGVLPQRGRVGKLFERRTPLEVRDVPAVGAHPYPLYAPLEEQVNSTGPRATFRAATNNLEFYQKYWGYVLFPTPTVAEEFQPMTAARLQRQMDVLSESVYLGEKANSQLSALAAGPKPTDALSAVNASSVAPVPDMDTVIGSDAAPKGENTKPVEKLWAELELSNRELLGRVSDSLGPNQKRLYLLTQSPADLVSEEAARATLQRYGLQVDDAAYAALSRGERIAAEAAVSGLAALPADATATTDAELVAEALGERAGRFTKLADGREALAGDALVLNGLPVDVSGAGLAKLASFMNVTHTAGALATLDGLQKDELLDLGLITRFFQYAKLRAVDLQDPARLEGRFIASATEELRRAKVTAHAARAVRFCGFNARKVEYLRLQLSHFYRWFARCAGYPVSMAADLARLELGAEEVEALGLDTRAAARATPGALLPGQILSTLASGGFAPTAEHVPHTGVALIDRELLAAHEHSVLNAYIAATDPDLAQHLNKLPVSAHHDTTPASAATTVIAERLGVDEKDQAVAALVASLPATFAAAAGNPEVLRGALAPSVYPQVADWVSLGYTAEEAAAVEAHPVVKSVLARFRAGEPLTVKELTLVAALPEAPASLKQELFLSAANSREKQWFHSPATDANATHFSMAQFFADARAAAAAGALAGKDSDVPAAIVDKLKAEEASAVAAAAAVDTANASGASLLVASAPNVASAEFAAGVAAAGSSTLAAVSAPAGAVDPLVNLSTLLDLRMPSPAADAQSLAAVAQRVAMNRFVLAALDAQFANGTAAAEAAADAAAPVVTVAAELSPAAAAAAAVGASATGVSDLDAVLLSLSTPTSSVLPAAGAAPLSTADRALLEAKRVDLAIRAAQVAFISAAAPEVQTHETAAAAERVLSIAERLANLRRRALSPSADEAPAPREQLTAFIAEELALSQGLAGDDAASKLAAERYLPEDSVFATVGHRELQVARYALRQARVFAAADKAAATYESTVTVARVAEDGSIVPVSGPSIDLAMSVAAPGASVTVPRTAELPFEPVNPLRKVVAAFGEGIAADLVEGNGALLPTAQVNHDFMSRLEKRMAGFVNNSTPDLTKWSMEDDIFNRDGRIHAGNPTVPFENDDEINHRAFAAYLGATEQLNFGEYGVDLFLHRAPGAIHDPDNAAGSDIVLSSDPRQYLDMDSFNVSAPAVPAGYFAARKAESRDDRFKVLMSGLRFVSRSEVNDGEFKITADQARRLGIDYDALQKRIGARVEATAAAVSAGQQANIKVAQVLAAKLAAKGNASA